MNQFKKAKQLRSETGQVTESITDLKTAGVSQKQENTENPITTEKEASQNNTNINTTIDTKYEESEVSSQLPINTTNNTTPIVVEPSIIEPAEKLMNKQPFVHGTEEPPIPEPSYENVISNSTPSMIQETIDNNFHKTPNTAAQVINEPIIGETTIPANNPPVEYNVSPPITMQSFSEPQPPQEITTAKHNKSTKKAVPNIFAPKSEAKSMRKSLVLKPTSVKIAENYCEKNGGSFNELIQTLLDNFIDEYGL